MGGWVLFRCDTLAHAVDYFQALAGVAAGDPRSIRSRNSSIRWSRPRW